jgi:hypothetical protein
LERLGDSTGAQYWKGVALEWDSDWVNLISPNLDNPNVDKFISLGSHLSPPTDAILPSKR